MIGFHTPQRPTPLNLDLAEISGGGSCPTQFYGKTHDGREVYVRYRGGVLSVQVAQRIGDNVYHAVPLVDVVLGPIYNGDISLAQFCDLFRVTINGTVPEDVTAEEVARLDLSGNTTFFRASLNAVTRDTATAIARVCLERVPDARLVQPVFNELNRVARFEEVAPEEIKAWSASIVTGVDSAAQLEEVTPIGMALQTGQLLLRMTYTRWKYPDPLYTDFAVEQLKELGKTVFVAGRRGLPPEHAIAHESFQMAADISTEDSDVRACLAGLEPLVTAHFPETPMVRIDLLSGEILGRRVERLDQALSSWCADADGRYLSVHRVGRDGPWVGLRPARPTELA